MVKLGYAISFLSARRLFSYLDHIQAGTVAANGGYDTDHRRRKTYHDTLLRFTKRGVQMMRKRPVRKNDGC